MLAANVQPSLTIVRDYAHEAWLKMIANSAGLGPWGNWIWDDPTQALVYPELRYLVESLEPDDDEYSEPDEYLYNGPKEVEIPDRYWIGYSPAPMDDATVWGWVNHIDSKNWISKADVRAFLSATKTLNRHFRALAFNQSQKPQPTPHRTDSSARAVAIPTMYADVLFRSRLEARYAYFFDRLGLEWFYEFEGFSLPSGWYLPDFWLPKLGAHGIWVEVKPTDPTDLEILRVKELGDSGDWGALLAVGPPPGGLAGGNHPGTPAAAEAAAAYRFSY